MYFIILKLFLNRKINKINFKCFPCKSIADSPLECSAAFQLQPIIKARIIKSELNDHLQRFDDYEIKKGNKNSNPHRSTQKNLFKLHTAKSKKSCVPFYLWWVTIKMEKYQIVLPKLCLLRSLVHLHLESRNIKELTSFHVLRVAE